MRLELSGPLLQSLTGKRKVDSGGHLLRPPLSELDREHRQTEEGWLTGITTLVQTRFAIAADPEETGETRRVEMSAPLAIGAKPKHTNHANMF